MGAYIANNIETTFDSQGLAAAQDMYRAWFISTTIYARYKETVDTILSTDGHGDCAVTG